MSTVTTALERLHAASVNVHARLLGTVDVTPVAPPGLETPIKTLLNWLMWGGLIAVIAGLIIGGIMMALANRRGESSEHVKYIGVVVLAGAIISAAGTIGSALVK